MKTKLLPFILILFCFVLTTQLSLADNPKGFEDPALLGKVLKGEILAEDMLSTKTEFRTIFRSFFNKVSSDAYVDWNTNHPRWPELVPEIKEGKTTKVNEDHTVFEYWLHVKILYGFFEYEVYPEGRQTITPALDAVSETSIHNQITNYTEDIKLAEATTRLIPYQSGILVEDNVYIGLQKESPYSDVAKKEAKKKYATMIVNLRQKLQGEP